MDYFEKYYDIENFHEIRFGRNKYWFRRTEQTLAVVDIPKDESLTAMIAHPSEAGWNLPEDHERHFWKLPLGNFSNIPTVWGRVVY